MAEEPFRHAGRRARRVLLALLSGAGNLSGYDLGRVAQAGSGAVYPVLDRLEAAGWVTAGWDPEETPNGGRRRYYALTPYGRVRVMGVLGLTDPPPPGTRLAELPPSEPPAPRWPRCRFRFVTSADDVRAGRWRRCDLPWGHWLHRGSRHQGPLIAGAAR